MPFKSDAQRKLCYVLKGKGQAGSWDCAEWSEATGGKKLPEHVEDQTEKKALGITNKLKGGVGDNKNPADLDKAELNSGIKEEKEHTNDTDVATEIAVDHLTKTPNYYSKLDKVEKRSAMHIIQPSKFAELLAKVAAARPGLWANIRAKKKRGESAAKPGDEDYPDSKNWSKVTAISEKKVEKQAIAALFKTLGQGALRAMSKAPMTTAAVGIGGAGAYEATRPTNKLIPKILPNAATPPTPTEKTGWSLASLAKQAVASLNPAQAASASIGSSILNGAQPAMAGHMQTVAKTYDASTPKQMIFNGKPAGQPFYRGDLQQQPGPTNTVGYINANTGVFNRYQGASGHTAQSSSGGRFGTYAPSTAVAAQGGYQKTSGVLQAVSAAGQALGLKGLAKGVSTGFGAFRKPLTTLGNSVPEGILATERNQALQAGNKFLSSFKPEGFNVYAGRVKTPGSIAGHGTEQATNDLLGFRLSSKQGYGQPAVDMLTKQLTDAGVNINSSKMLVRPGYHGHNIKGDLHGSPVEFQLSPRRLQGLNAADHSMVYKPQESGVNPTIGKMYAPLFQYGMTVASPMVPAATRLGYGAAGAGAVGAVGAGGYAATR